MSQNRRRFCLLMFLVAFSGGCKSREAQPAAVVQNLDSELRPSWDFFFHWGSVSANNDILAASGYQGAYPFENGEIPSRRSEGLVNDRVINLLHSWYAGNDAAGPGLYVSSSFGDSHVFGTSLLIVERRGGADPAASIPSDFDLSIKSKSERAWDEGSVGSLASMVQYLPTWFVISRAPRAEEPTSLAVYGPAASDVRRVAEAMKVKLAPVDYLRIMSDFFRVTSGQVEKPVATARVFVDRLFFDEGFPVVREVDLDKLQDDQLQFFEKIVKHYLDYATGSAKTKVLIGKELDFIRRTGRVSSTFAARARSVFAGLSAAEVASLIAKIVASSPPHHSLRLLAEMKADLAPSDLKVWLATLRQTLLRRPLAAPLHETEIYTFISLLKSDFDIDVALDKPFMVDVRLSFIRGAVASPALGFDKGAYRNLFYSAFSSDLPRMDEAVELDFASKIPSAIEEGANMVVPSARRSLAFGAALFMTIDSWTTSIRISDEQRAAWFDAFHRQILSRASTIAEVMRQPEIYAFCRHGMLPELAKGSPVLRAAILEGLNEAIVQTPQLWPGSDPSVLITMRTDLLAAPP